MHTNLPIESKICILWSEVASVILVLILPNCICIMMLWTIVMIVHGGDRYKTGTDRQFTECQVTLSSIQAWDSSTHWWRTMLFINHSLPPVNHHVIILSPLIAVQRKLMVSMEIISVCIYIAIHHKKLMVPWN